MVVDVVVEDMEVEAKEVMEAAMAEVMEAAMVEVMEAAMVEDMEARVDMVARAAMEARAEDMGVDMEARAEAMEAVMVKTLIAAAKEAAMAGLLGLVPTTRALGVAPPDPAMAVVVDL